ncbi:MAG TPA: GNAT family N-acetyltransferase [Candidatus Limnocylindria bacterium]|nr:GNAT family N-acetyltransferase [Candidatus Limnocylindria bacterium]
MRAEERDVLLHGGAARLRTPLEGDAEAMLAHLRDVCAETHFLERSPGDPMPTLEDERRFLSLFAQSPDRVMMGVFLDGGLIASASVAPAAMRRKTRHRAEIGLSVRREYWGQGLGALLMEEGIRAARAMGYLRLELAVFADNERAVRLYERFGFTRHGALPNAFRLEDGTFRDCLLMGLELQQDEKEDGRIPHDDA